jgi:hypothetical protein
VGAIGTDENKTALPNGGADPAIAACMPARWGRNSPDPARGPADIAPIMSTC